MRNKSGLRGEVRVQLFGPDGVLKEERTVKNTVTTVGEGYYAAQMAAGVGGNTAPTLANGMKLGSGTATPTKSGAGASIATSDYISGSNVAFASVTVSPSPGSDEGYQVEYVATWGPGVATATIREAAIVTDRLTDDTMSGAPVCIARVLTGEIVKGASDFLTLTWTHTLGGFVRYAANVGALTAETPLTITHNLNTTDVDVVLRDIATGEIIAPSTVKVVDANSVSLTTSQSYAADTFRILVQP